MTISFTARVAGLAVIGAEAAAVGKFAEGRPPVVVWVVFLALQVAAVVWATDRRSAAALRKVAPALLIAVGAAALWTASALTVPEVATDNLAALAVIFLTGLVVATASPGAGRRLPLGLLASAGSALLIFLVIAWLLPAIPGFISNSHPPTYPALARLVDPIGEFALAVLLAVAFGVERLRARTRRSRAATGDRRPDYGRRPNEMVVERGP